MPTAESTRSPVIPAPTSQPFTYRGEDISPGLILRLWREGQAFKKASRDAILKVRAMRRRESESLVKLAPEWTRNNPEAAGWVRECLEQRTTLERDLIARAGSVEPELSREPLGFLDTDEDNAEDCEAYLEEWRKREVPFQAFIGKNVEDGEFGLLVTPSMSDLEGCPDFFDYLDERAYAALKEDKKAEYQRDENDRRQRYVRTDTQGRKQKNPKYDKGSETRSREAHDEAVTRYLLDKKASAVRVIPALDCAPIFSRGTGRDRWTLTALVERTGYYVEELLQPEEGERGYGWHGMGDRKVIPLAYNPDGSGMRITSSETRDGRIIWVYTAYVLCRDKEGKTHPIMASTVGGAPTWDVDAEDAGSDMSVAFTDFYEKYGIQTPLWSYHGGLHSEDDSPDHYWRPYLWPLYERIRIIEGNKTSTNASIAVNGTPGQMYTPDSKLAEIAPEAAIEPDGSLKRPRIPRAGEVEVSAGAFSPVVPAQVSGDMWRGLQMDMMSLQAATAVDQNAGTSSASGNAQIVATTLGQVAKRHVREGALSALVSASEKHLRILHAIWETFGVKWPIQMTKKKPVGHAIRSGRQPLEYNPEWVGDGHFNLVAEYPDEFNPVTADMFSRMQAQGQVTFEKLQAALGEKDAQSVWIEIKKDQLKASPEVDQVIKLRVARATGNRDLTQVIKALQAQQKLTVAGVPGASNGIPTAALNRPGQQQGSGGGLVSNIRGGVASGITGSANAAAEAQAAMQGAA